MDKIYTYILKEEGSNRYKIGQSRDPNDRKGTLQTGNPDNLIEVFRAEGNFEKKLHDKFDHLRVDPNNKQKEWFYLNEALVKEAEAITKSKFRMKYKCADVVNRPLDPNDANGITLSKIVVSLLELAKSDLRLSSLNRGQLDKWTNKADVVASLKNPQERKVFELLHSGVLISAESVTVTDDFLEINLGIRDENGITNGGHSTRLSKELLPSMAKELEEAHLELEIQSNVSIDTLQKVTQTRNKTTSFKGITVADNLGKFKNIKELGLGLDISYREGQPGLKIEDVLRLLEAVNYNKYEKSVGPVSIYRNGRNGNATRDFQADVEKYDKLKSVAPLCFDLISELDNMLVNMDTNLNLEKQDGSKYTFAPYGKGSKGKTSTLTQVVKTSTGLFLPVYTTLRYFMTREKDQIVWEYTKEDILEIYRALTDVSHKTDSGVPYSLLVKAIFPNEIKTTVDESYALDTLAKKESFWQRIGLAVQQLKLDKLS